MQRTATIQIKVTPDEKRTAEEYAKQQKIPLSVIARAALFEKMKDEKRLENG